MIIINKVVIIGRLTKEIELKYLPNGDTAIAKFTLATDRVVGKGKEKASDFIPVVVFGKSAEFIAQYGIKGKLIAVSGRIQTGSYEAKDGTKRYTTDVIADEVNVLEWGDKKEATKKSGYSDFEPNDSSDSIPF